MNTLISASTNSSRFFLTGKPFSNAAACIFGRRVKTVKNCAGSEVNSGVNLSEKRAGLTTTPRFKLTSGPVLFPGEVEKRVSYLNQCKIDHALINHEVVETLLVHYKDSVSDSTKRVLVKKIGSIVRERLGDIQQFASYVSNKSINQHIPEGFIHLPHYLTQGAQACDDIHHFFRNGQIHNSLSSILREPISDSAIRDVVGFSEATCTMAENADGVIQGYRGFNRPIDMRAHLNLYRNQCIDLFIDQPKTESVIHGFKVVRFREALSYSSSGKPIPLILARLSYLLDGLAKVNRRIFVTISPESAAALREYLASWQVNQLFSPIAGSGYFASQLARVGIDILCSDITPPPDEQAYHPVIKSDAIEAMELLAPCYNQGPGRCVRDTALLIDGPPPLATDPKKGKFSLPINSYLPQVVSQWHKQGGRKLMVFSEATREKLLFCPEKLKSLGLYLRPADPAVPASVFKGLGEYVGVCGAYKIESLS